MVKITGNSYKVISPNPGNGYNVRNVNPAGSVNNNNATNANGVVPDCEIGQNKVSHIRPKSEHSRKEWLSGLPGKGGEYIGADAVSLRETGTAVNSASSPKEIICSFENLYKAAYICKRNVIWKDSVAGFMLNVLANCHTLNKELLNGTYKLSRYNVFLVHEKKTRIIVSTGMRDRVIQRSLCDNYLTKYLTRSFIYDSTACLPGKGTDMARNRLTCHLQRFHRKHGLNGWVLKVDIHDYFGSTPHSVAKAAVDKRVPDPWVRQHVHMIIDSFQHISPDKGMGLGSQITQLVQLAVLDDIDHYIKEKLRIKGYVRYMDDFILIHEDKEHLKRCLADISRMLTDIGLELNEKKTGIQPISNGIHFLGFSFRLTKTGRVVKTILHKKVSKEKRKLRKLYKMVKAGKMDRKRMDECYNSWRAHAGKGHCHGLILKMDQFYKNLFKEERDV